MRIAIIAILCIAIFCNFEPAKAAGKVRFVDSCTKMSKELKQAKGASGRMIVSRSILGGILGAAAGALISDKKSKGEGILVGAAAGASLGAATGYIEEKRREHSDRAALAGSIYEDAAKNNAEAARALRAFSDVRRCRADAAMKIKAEVQSGKLDDVAARDFLGRHKLLLENDIAQAEYYTTNFDQAMEKFRGAAGFLAEGNPNDQAYVANLPGASVPPPAPPPIAKSRIATALRDKATVKSAVVGKLGKGESVELTGAPEAGWQQVRTGDGRTGYALANTLVVQPGPAKPKVNLGAVSAEVRTVSQPLYEGVEKRREIDAELQLAKVSTANETFILAS